MLTIAMLAGGVKGFFENPEYLLGIPLAAVGVLGVLLAISALAPFELRWPEPVQYEPEQLVEPEEGHPSPATYIQVGIILAVVTAIEVAFYYIDIAQGVLLGVLLTLSLLKFVLVVLWFMHLRFDSRILSVLFTGGMALAGALFIVVLATLGANLV